MQDDDGWCIISALYADYHRRVNESISYNSSASNKFSNGREALAGEMEMTEKASRCPVENLLYTDLKEKSIFLAAVW